MSTEPRSRAWIEVDAAALRENLATIRAASGEGVGLLPMVKADAYGIGLEGTVRTLEADAPWGYGVATVAEGERIRALGVRRPVLILCPVPDETIESALAGRLTLSVSDLRGLRRIVEVAEGRGLEGAVHVDVDTGMGRTGFDWREVGMWGPEVMGRTGGRIRWEGTFSHLHSADEPGGPEVEVQAERLREVMNRLREIGGGGEAVHLENSAGALRAPRRGFDLVRPGIFLYGGAAGEGLPDPAPVVSLRARVLLVREVPAGTTVGYGATYRAPRRERWATLGIGYGDGWSRSLGNRGQAIVHGRRVPIIGRISMDLTVVDITDLPRVGIGDEATLIGRCGDESISVDEVAALAGTISYEVLTGLTPRLPRVWSEEERAGSSP